RKQASDEYAHGEPCESSAPTGVFPDAIDDLCNAQAYDEVQVGIEVNQGGVDHRETRDGKQPAGATASAALQFEFLFHQRLIRTLRWRRCECSSCAGHPDTPPQLARVGGGDESTARLISRKGSMPRPVPEVTSVQWPAENASCLNSG